MPTSTPAPSAAPALNLRAAIDIDIEYIVQTRTSETWSRPVDAEHGQLPGLDVWHAVRRARRSYAAQALISEHGILTLTTATAAMRFIPADAYADYFCSAQDCEESTEDGEGWQGLCGNCADRAYAKELDEDTGESISPAVPASPTPRSLPATPDATAPAYSSADLRTAATVYGMLLDALDPQSGVGEGIGDHTIPSTEGTTVSRTWQSLGDDEASQIYDVMRQLLDAAPDLSRWAVDMAAEQLLPVPEPLTRWQDDAAAVRVHLAFAGHVTAEQRASIQSALRLVLRADL